jgi:phage baseplate assembly protein W|tara:strand:+ start:861 stop:1262 length:402 start_codon:yes stop_codon:yes gene_type:complete
MPVERVSKGFKDLSSSFQTNPLSNDLLGIKNETAIARSIRNLVLTQQGERPFNSILGSKVSGLLFENLDEITGSAIRDEIRTTINNFEPRVNLLEVKVLPDYDGYEYNVTIRYEIVGIDVSAQQLAFALQPTR